MLVYQRVYHVISQLIGGYYMLLPCYDYNLYIFIAINPDCTPKYVPYFAHGEASLTFTCDKCAMIKTWVD